MNFTPPERGATLESVLSVNVSETRSLVMDYSYAFMQNFTVKSIFTYF